MDENIRIRINRSSFVLVTQTHLHYIFGVVNEIEKVIPIKGIKSYNYNPSRIDKTQSGCNIFAGFLGGMTSGHPYVGDVETRFPELAIEFYPEGHRWPRIIKISQPDLSKETADKIIAAIKNR